MSEQQKSPMLDIAKELEDRLCEFTPDPDDECEECHRPLRANDPVYFFSDGGYDCREGTYRCKKCATAFIKGWFQ